MKKSFKDHFYRITALIILEAFLLTLLPQNVMAKENDLQITQINADKETASSLSLIAMTDNGIIPQVKQGKRNNLCNLRNLWISSENTIVINDNKANAEPDKNIIIKYKEVSLEIPSGSVKETTEIKIEELKEVNKLNPGMENVTDKVIGYRFLPHGIKFDKHIKIILPYDKTKVNNDEDLINTYTFFYNEETHFWEKLQKVNIDKGKGMITSLTDHFTDMINGTLKLPESPKPMSFNINAIKDIKAGNPASNIPQIEGLKANSFGNANFSLPLSVPAGRNGMTPQLSFDYNSEAGNGWLGVGFDINIPCITIDTRFGLPKYNGNDTYLLNGMELLRIDSDGDDVTYSPRVEGSFQKIIRKVNNENNYYFEITGKDGTKQTYGTQDAVLDSSKGIYKWYLKKIEDTNGNNIRYYYHTGSGYTYLEKITYTGYGETDGSYFIMFENDEASRNDVVVNCRGKFVSKLEERLKYIKIYYGENLIRSYQLDYGYNDFGKSEIETFSEYVRKDSDNPGEATKLFYSYKFKYKSIKTGNDSLDGYKNVVEVDNTGNAVNSCDGPSIDYSFGGGGSIYLGVGFLLWCFSVGGNIGFNIDYNFNNSCFMDINGDGLTDIIQKDYAGSNVTYRLNEGNYEFDNAQDSHETLNGSLMSEERQVGFDVGVSGGLSSIISGSFGGKFNWSYGLSRFIDLDGDGFIDYVPSSYYSPVRSWYLKNDEGSFDTFNWGENTNIASSSIADDPSTDTVKNALYLVDPVIKWKPFKRGLININSKAVKIGNSNENENDGVKLDVYKNNESLKDNSNDGVLTIDSQRYDLNKDAAVDSTGDNIYFRANSIKDIGNDRIDWDIEISYKKIFYRDDLDDYFCGYIIKSFVPIEFDSFKSDLPENDITFIDSCYIAVMDINHENILYYSFDTSISPDNTNRLRTIFAGKRFIIPVLMEKVIFEDILALLLNYNSTYYEVIQGMYKPEENSPGYYKLCIDTNSIQDSVYRELSTYLEEYINRIKYYKYSYNDKDYIVKSEKQDEYYIELEDSPRSGTSIIASAGTGDNPGIIKNKGVLIDCAVDENNNILTKKWLKDDGTNAQISIEDTEGNIVPEDSAMYTTSRNSSTNELEKITEIYNQNEKKTYAFSNVSNLFYKINHDLFIDLSNDINIDPDNTHDLTKCYTLNTTDNYFYLNADPDTSILTVILNEIKERGIFTFNSMKKAIKIYSGGCYNVVILDNPDAGIEEETVADSTTENTSNITRTSYFIINDFLSNGYTLSKKIYLHVFNRKNDFTNESVKNDTGFDFLLKESLEAGLFEERLTYLSNKKVECNNRSSMTNKELLNTVYKKSVDGTYYLLDTVQAAVVLDTANDRQITYGDKAKAALYTIGYGKEYFTCGVYNWFYGEWIGDEEWDEVKIGITDENNNRIYLTGMAFISEDETANGKNINRTGFDIWKGSDFEYTDRKGDSSGITVSETKYFANYISKNEINPSRKGGDSIKYIAQPSGKAPRSGFTTDDYISRAFTWSINTGVTVVGITGNFTYSRTNGLVDFLDINGDNYPDYVTMSPYSYMNVLYNHKGSYFSGSNHYGMFYGNEGLRTTLTTTTGAGTGLSSQMINDWIAICSDSYGNVSKADLGKPSINLGVTVGGVFSGTMTVVDWADMNGDGLVDQICRDNSTPGIFRVNLNTGDGFEDANWEIEDWDQNTEGSLLSSTNAIRNSWLYGGNFQASIGGGVQFQTVGFSGGCDLSFGVNAKATMLDMIDINGDGLPDQVYKKNQDGYFKVKLNLGDRFGDMIDWHAPDWGVTTTGLTSRTVDEFRSYLGCSDTNGVTLDCNYDSLGDSLNSASGSGNGNGIDLDAICDTLDYRWSINVHAGIDFSIGIPLVTCFGVPIINFYITPSGSFAFSRTGGNLQMTDIDGDGLPDHVLTYKSKMLARINNSGMAGLLEEITTPSGGKVLLTYKKNNNTVDLPQCHYQLNTVTRFDGVTSSDGNTHIYTQIYDYENGYYDRQEREFFGYSKVIENNPNNTNIISYYYNDCYEKKGILYKTELRDENNVLYTCSTNNYTFELQAQVGEKYVVFPRPDSSINTNYDVTSGQSISTGMRYETYDEYKNIARAVDMGIVNEAGSDLNVTDNKIINIQYDYNTTKYIVNTPKELAVTDYSNNLLRKRTAAYDNNTGNLLTLTQYADETNMQKNPAVNFTYDDYGNIETVTDPAGYQITYTYDQNVHSYVTMIRDSGGYYSEAEYNYKFGVDTKTIDINRKEIIKEYDDFGRLWKVWTGYDNYMEGVSSENQTGTPAVEFEYYIENINLDEENGVLNPARAVTRNKIHFDPANTDTLDTVIIIDGLNRVIQTKKEGEVIQANSTDTAYGMNVSGKVIYDIMGRVFQQGQPVFEADNTNSYMYNPNVELKNETTNTYDLLGRIVKVTLHDEAEINNTYEIISNQYVTTAEDPKGSRKISYADSNENIVKIEQFNNGQTITTGYEYDLLNQITKVMDDRNNITSIVYDLLGRRTGINNPDSGLVEYRYDIRSNVIEKIDSNTRKKVSGIKYEYDASGRLAKIKYPADTLEKRTVTYEYGEMGASLNRSGRLSSLTDESGVTEFSYGNLGEQTTVRKTLNRILELDGTYTFETGYLYDYLGRMEEITYPGTFNKYTGIIQQGETVHYEYDLGGQVKSVYGKYPDVPENIIYVEKIAYDEFGQRSYIKYKNGVETRYTYDEDRRWLENINTANGNGEVFQNITYQFDEVGNILSTLNQKTPVISIRQEYHYDDLYQLVSAEGVYRGIFDRVNTYNQAYIYDSIGNMTQKTSIQYTNSASSDNKLNYDFAYQYDPLHPHRAIQIGDVKYKYDDNGNLIKKYVDIPGSNNNDGDDDNGITPDPNSDDEAYGYDWSKSGNNENALAEYTWDDENRLKQAKVNSKTSLYLYNAGGERTCKKEINGKEVIYVDSLYQIEVNSYNDTITKHVFVGDTRLVSKISYGNLRNNELFEQQNTYFYHSDHLGSSNFITDYEGREYEHIEYTAWGETWVEESKDTLEFMKWKFTSKELDDETGLYYFGARYLDSQTSRWISADPIYDGVKDGFGVFTYCRNNPLIYHDPTGLEVKPIDVTRFLARGIIGNPINAYITQNGWFKGLFWLGGFTRDSDGVYHARQDCLQQYGGYNDFYDTVFDYATSMDKAKFEFNMDGKDYIFWAWKGDYLNLGAGAEMGIYTSELNMNVSANYKGDNVEIGINASLNINGQQNHWFVDTSLALPMTLTLTDNKGNTIANYKPGDNQWWITVFNPYYQDVKAGNLTASFTIDFSSNRKMYDAFYDKYFDNPSWRFDNKNHIATFKF